MTSAELWSIAEPVEAEGAEAGEGAPGERGAAVTPWSGQRGGRAGSPALPAVNAPPAVSAPDAPATPAAPVSGPAPGPPGSVGIPGVPGITVPSALLPPALRPQAPGGAAVPGNPAGAAAPGSAAPGAPTQVAPPAQPVAAPQDPPPPAVDPDTLAAALPAAAMAGTMALGMLPTLAEALLGGGNPSGAGTTAPASAGTTAPAAGTATAAGLSPQDQRVLEVLKALVAAYGDGDPKDPEVAALRKELGLGSGTGSGAAGVKARQLYQANFATAYNTLDNQLATYITRTAGNTKVDRTAIHNLLREVNIAINELGPQAYTREGRQQVHKILTAALTKANAIAGNTSAGNADTAAFINQLTAQYLNNIAGRKTPVSGGGAGAPASGKVKTALDTARAQFGKPYVWGHEGPNSFDCSGLMQYAARAAGVKIPRVAADQYRALPKVTGPLKPGDLVFPADSFDSNGNPGHVIMYAGNGVCYAASKKGVPLGEVPLPKNYRAARWA